MNIQKNLELKTMFTTYTVKEQLGEGGNGVVWKALDEQNKPFAIKFMKRDTSTEKRKRFKNEAWFCLKHEHKNIMNILDYGTQDFGDGEEISYYIMPLYFETLRTKMERGINPDDAIEIYKGILEGLKYAHQQSVIHRDIKPENILFTENSNVPVIADFGIAHFLEQDKKTMVETKPNSKMANYAYRAPEQIQNANVTAKADVYSATLILNEMFTGQIPGSANYRTIGSVNSEYAFLDKLFNEIYKQNPDDRLFPEDAILKDLQILIEDSKLEREKKRITLEKWNTKEFIPYKAEIEDINYDSIRKRLSIKMKEPFSQEWAGILCSGGYSYSSMMGKGPEQFACSGNVMWIILNHGYQNDIETIIRNYKGWMPTVDGLYNKYRQREIRNQEKEFEERRRKELEQIEINQKLKKYI